MAQNDASDHSITKAVHDWQRGDDQAAFDLDRRMRADLLALVRSRRNRNLRARIDSDAVVNAALKSFLSGVRGGEFPVLNDRRDVRRLLTHFAICVLRDQIRCETAAKRNPVKEVNHDIDLVTKLADESALTPEDRATAVEYWEKFPEIVRGVHERSIEILEASLEGLTPTQIARETGLGVRTVQRIIQMMIEAWNSWLNSEDGHGMATTGSNE